MKIDPYSPVSTQSVVFHLSHVPYLFKGEIWNAWQLLSLFSKINIVTWKICKDRLLIFVVEFRRDVLMLLHNQQYLFYKVYWNLYIIAGLKHPNSNEVYWLHPDMTVSQVSFLNYITRTISNCTTTWPKLVEPASYFNACKWASLPWALSCTTVEHH